MENFGTLFVGCGLGLAMTGCLGNMFKIMHKPDSLFWKAACTIMGIAILGWLLMGAAFIWKMFLLEMLN